MMDYNQFIELYIKDSPEKEDAYLKLSREDKYRLIKNFRVIEGVKPSTLISNFLEWEKDSVIRADFVKIAGEQTLPEIEKMLYEGLRDVDSRVRANIIEILGDKKGRDIEELLLPFLNDPSSRVKANVIKALWKLEDPLIIDNLRWMIQSKDIWMKLSSLYVISETKTDLFEKDIVDCLSSEFESVREKAVSLCGSLQLKSSVDKLIEMIDEENEFVRGEVITSLGMMGVTQACDKIYKILNNDNSPVFLKLRCIESLGNFRDINTGKVLISIVCNNNEEENLRIASLKAFMKLGIKNYNLILADLLLDINESFELRENASFALGELADDEVFKYLADKISPENKDFLERIIKMYKMENR